MSALKSVADSVSQDWERLSQYLRTHGMAFESMPAPQQFAGGFANLNYLVRIDGGEAVLRRPPMGPLPPGAYDMGRESKILSRLALHFPLAPRAIHLCEDASVLGAPFQITEYRRGISIRDTLPAAWANDPAIAARLGTMLIDVLAQFHRLDPETVGLGDLGKPQGFLARAVEGWIKRAGLALEGIATAEQTTRLNAVAAWLRSHTAPDRHITLLHNDFKLDNLLLNAETMQPVALLDWDQGTRGDGLFDLATLLTYWTQADDPAGLRAMRQMPTEQPGFATRREAANAYALATGRDLGEFRFHLALANLKTSVIFQQLHQRYRSGETSDPRYAEFADVADALLQRAHDIAFHNQF